MVNTDLRVDHALHGRYRGSEGKPSKYCLSNILHSNRSLALWHPLLLYVQRTQLRTETNKVKLIQLSCTVINFSFWFS